MRRIRLVERYSARHWRFHRWSWSRHHPKFRQHRPHPWPVAKSSGRTRRRAREESERTTTIWIGSSTTSMPETPALMDGSLRWAPESPSLKVQEIRPRMSQRWMIQPVCRPILDAVPERPTRPTNPRTSDPWNKEGKQVYGWSITPGSSGTLGTPSDSLTPASCPDSTASLEDTQMIGGPFVRATEVSREYIRLQSIDRRKPQ